MYSDKEKLVSLTKLHDATNNAVSDLEAKNKALMDENLLLREKLINCQKAVDINKEVVRNALTIQNEQKDSYAAEIRELKDKIKELENGS